MTLDPAAVERFRDDLLRTLGPQGSHAVLALAVSGGPDSMAMLALAHAAFPDHIIVATVDHGLRSEAAQEADMVAAHCARLGVPHATLHPGAPISGASIQARAREARYALLLGWALNHKATALLTAHHVEDQAETFLMRAARGSGVAGLAGIRPRRELAGEHGRTLTLIRPLLHWRRAELRAVAEANGPFVEDPSNSDPDYDRSRFRRLIAESPDLDPAQIAATATYAAEAQQALEQVTALLWRNRAEMGEDGVTIDFEGLNRELTRRLARRAIGHLLAKPFDAEGIEPLLDAYEAGKGATRAGVMMSVRGTVATFRPAPPRRSH